jgi:hypothetical protein
MELQDFLQPWHISRGWALDLYLGVAGRVHGDVDMQVAFADQGALQQHLTSRGWKFVTPFKGRFDPWPMHTRLEMPRYRREPSILQSAERIGLRTANGIPYLAPELVLLYKSRNTSDSQDRSKDQDDFERMQARLTPERRAWLRWALLTTSPDHAWLQQLD